MEELWKLVALGAIQGLTEFLPVSSSAHLLAAQEVFGLESGEKALAFDAALHLATVLAVLVYFHRDLWRIARSPERWGVLTRIVLGTIPAAALALAFREARQGASPWLAVLGWTISAVYLQLTRGRDGRFEHAQLPLWRAAAIGATQGFAAVIPGLSRSGLSISSGLWLGLKRPEAARFSFLLAIPITLGAGLVEGRKLLQGNALSEVGGWGPLIASLLVAFVVGLAAVHLLFRAVRGDRFHRFGWYNLSAALAFSLYLLLRNTP